MLMWLLNATPAEKLKSMATYFKPTIDFFSKKVVLETDEERANPSVFCIGYEPVSGIGENENYCKSAYEKVTKLTLPARPDLLSGVARYGLLGFYTAYRAASLAANAAAKKGCEQVSLLNYYALSRFLLAYKQDVANRKKTFLKLANEISKENPRDIEGTSIREGIYRTLMNNLTSQNSAALKSAFGEKGEGSNNQNAQFEIQNSLALGDCASKGNDVEPPGWVSEVLFWYPYFFLEADCTGDDATSYSPKIINLNPVASRPNNLGQGNPPIVTQEFFDQINSFVMEPPPENTQTRIWHSSMGFEKNPWCLSYFGVKATTSPTLPFSPGFKVTLTAKAFAKPFGGKLGPWYGATWPAGANLSSKTPELSEESGPIRRLPGIDIDVSLYQTNDKLIERSFNRYLGDKAGIRSNLSVGYMQDPLFKYGAIKLSWWDHLFLESIGEPKASNDPLAWDSDNGEGPFMRDLEIEAIAPNIFDVTHYSIESDWYDNYLTKIRKGFATELDFLIRGDLGSRENGNDETLKKFSIKDQIKHLSDGSKLRSQVGNKLNYTLLDSASMLTHWQSPTPDSFILDTERFGKCSDPVDDKAIYELNLPGNCKKGGRVGYSVKLVSEDYLNRSDLEIGGKSAAGPIKNPPSMK
jgi:hypothetical protein